MRERWSDLADIVKRFKGKRVAVLGDLALDRFWIGAVQRISREAPVPIVRLLRCKLSAGCAANTVHNLADLGARPWPVGIVGTDAEGAEILRLFREMGFSTRGIVRRPDWETPTKTRILAGSLHGPRQQMVRVDSGEHNDLPEDILAKLRANLEHALEKCSALIISDYGYGLVERLGVGDYLPRVDISALDSRRALTRFRGITTATPNEEEFELACGRVVGDDEPLLEREGIALRRRLGMRALLVTRGARGMSLFQKGMPPVHIPVVGSDMAVDVTGAGDTVISTYVLSLCSGGSFLEAAHVANAAGSIVVHKHGTATATPVELFERLKAWGEGKL